MNHSSSFKPISAKTESTTSATTVFELVDIWCITRYIFPRFMHEYYGLNLWSVSHCVNDLKANFKIIWVFLQ